jgi:hypothetical protein
MLGVHTGFNVFYVFCFLALLGEVPRRAAQAKAFAPFFGILRLCWAPA